MSHANEYRQLLVNIGKASLARKMPKPYPLVVADTVMFGLMAILLVVFIVMGIYVKTSGGSPHSPSGIAPRSGNAGG